MKTFASLRKLWKQRPFEPFQIVLESGQRYDILSPEYIMVTNTALAIGRRKNKDDAEFDNAHVIGVLQVAAVEPLKSHAKKN